MAVADTASSTGPRASAPTSSATPVAGAAAGGMATASRTSPRPASATTTTNGARQLVPPPSRAPNGTPSTVAMVSPEPTIAIARPRRPGPIMAVAVVSPIANSVAWAQADSARPTITHA